MQGELLARFEAAERHRAPLRITATPKPSNKVRITRYRDGRVIEIIERAADKERRLSRIKVIKSTKPEPARRSERKAA